MKCGVVTFPGSNCDDDCFHILKNVYQLDTRWIWHKATSLEDFDFIVLPGGFSYGDYLRAGAIAHFSPIMKAVAGFAADGGHVLGICNGFQILTEAGLLPGALRRNQFKKFICRYLNLRVENHRTPFTAACREGEILRIPVAHAEGDYYAEPDTLREMEDNGQVLLRYCDDNGELTDAANPNGSVSSIAAVANAGGNVVGMMPHPERCADPVWPERDGQKIFDSLIQSLKAARA